MLIHDHTSFKCVYLKSQERFNFQESFRLKFSSHSRQLLNFHAEISAASDELLNDEFQTIYPYVRGDFPQYPNYLQPRTKMLGK